MPIKKKISKKWTGSDKSIKAIQVVFELESEQSKSIRIDAIKKDLSPSDYIRQIVGLPGKKPIRPRLSVSLSDEDYAILGKRYNIKPDKKDEIRQKMKDELIKASNI